MVFRPKIRGSVSNALCLATLNLLRQWCSVRRFESCASWYGQHWRTLLLRCSTVGQLSHVQVEWIPLLEAIAPYKISTWSINRHGVATKSMSTRSRYDKNAHHARISRRYDIVSAPFWETSRTIRIHLLNVFDNLRLLHEPLHLGRRLHPARHVITTVHSLSQELPMRPHQRRRMTAPHDKVGPYLYLRLTGQTSHLGLL